VIARVPIVTGFEEARNCAGPGIDSIGAIALLNKKNNRPMNVVRSTAVWEFENTYAQSIPTREKTMIRRMARIERGKSIWVIGMPNFTWPMRNKTQIWMNTMMVVVMRSPSI